VFHGKLEASMLDMEGVVGGKGCSFARRRRVSAATIPPIECPIRIVCTDGSTVGDGVACATSISITLFSSLDRSHLVSRPMRCYSPASAEVGKKIYGPFSESQDAIFELSSGLKLRVRYRHNIDLRQRMADESSDMVREGAKRIIAALSRGVLAFHRRCIVRGATAIATQW
jgi:hypothetical protein